MYIILYSYINIHNNKRIVFLFLRKYKNHKLFYIIKAYEMHHLRTKCNILSAITYSLGGAYLA